MPGGGSGLYSHIRPLERGLWWLVVLRWIACGGLILVIWLASGPLAVVEAPKPLYLSGLLLALYNALLQSVNRRINRLPGPWIEWILFLQISIDLAILTLLLYFSGIAENPFIFYYVFHIIIAGILLPDRYAYFLAALASTMVGSVFSLQFRGVIPEHPLSYFASGSHDGSFLLGKFIALASTLLFAAYFTISVLKQARLAEREIRQKEKIISLGQLVSGIIHQIKNPLDGLKNCLRHISSGSSRPENCDRFIALMSEELERIEGLTVRLQDYARPKGIEIQPVDINREVASAMKLLEIKDTGKVVIRTEFGTVPRAKADPFALQEVIINLCSNALAAMPNGGTLTVRTFHTTFKTGRPSNGVGIAVEDTGLGLRPEETELVFEPFYTTRKPAEGTGLGLWISQMLVGQMGGVIEVASTPGKGSTFSLVLQSD
ncbi:MAG: hypothetical protein A2Z86_07400 [Candidatus Glassbacteria bacterium GWA2_58_10]|uniref:histidine kinase n=1 Tax=Candidatus Glassbacteria bacterium GWA2_58_10 TaxID=1817865 RepID=A0A1F5YH46_9BACT|nr:MAG: hypothetical protein A2Z86_07400 [Candidatus Glassbacteria bacterium GWA2_58_10]